jgi:hypothetical protein
MAGVRAYKSRPYTIGGRGIMDWDMGLWERAGL